MKVSRYATVARCHLVSWCVVILHVWWLLRTDLRYHYFSSPVFKSAFGKCLLNKSLISGINTAYNNFHFTNHSFPLIMEKHICWAFDDFRLCLKNNNVYKVPGVILKLFSIWWVALIRHSSFLTLSILKKNKVGSLDLPYHFFMKLNIKVITIYIQVLFSGQ